MKKILNISILFSLLGLAGSFFYGLDQYGTCSIEPELSHSISTITDSGKDAVSHTDYPLLFKADNLSEINSEIDPRASISADFTSSKNRHFTQHRYLIRPSLFEVSQSVRNLIFPFHSHV